MNTSDDDDDFAAKILGTDAAFASDAAFAVGDGGDAVSASSTPFLDYSTRRYVLLMQG